MAQILFIGSQWIKLSWSVEGLCKAGVSNLQNIHIYISQRNKAGHEYNKSALFGYVH